MLPLWAFVPNGRHTLNSMYFISNMCLIAGDDWKNWQEGQKKILGSFVILIFNAL